MSVDEQLLAILATTGHLNADSVGRGARLNTCQECGRPILAGLDAEMCAIPAKADPQEVDEVGEYLALRIGLVTYNLTHSFSTKGTRRWELNPRCAAHIEAPRNTAVVAQHRCGMQLPPARTRFPHRVTPPPAPPGAEPPF